jgi:hypothetical protein
VVVSGNWPAKVDVVVVVEGVVDPVGPAVVLQQQPVHLGVGLLHGPAHERLDAEHAVLRDEQGVGLQSAFAGQDDHGDLVGDLVVDLGGIEEVGQLL